MRFTMSLKKVFIKIISFLSLYITLLLSPAFMDKAISATNQAGTIITTGGLIASPDDTILNNHGTILGGYPFNTNAANDSFAGMNGEHSIGSINYTFNNTGTITINFINTATGQININARALAYGMRAVGDGNHELTNSGSIELTAIGGTANSADPSASASTYGMTGSGQGSHRLTNSGSIDISARGGMAVASSGLGFAFTRVYGMRAVGAGSHELINYGSIDVAARGGTATNANAQAEAYGMSADGYGSHSLINYGSIDVAARGGTATNANAQATAVAYGIYVGGAPAGGGPLINNFGIVNASATGGSATATAGTAYNFAHAFEVYGVTNYSVGTFATTLRDWTVTTGSNVNIDTVFGIQTGNAINFRNSTLILRPGTANQGFELGKAYNVKDMIATVGLTSFDVRTVQQGDITGTIAEAIAEVPFLRAILTNGNDPFTATVRLESNVSEETTPGTTTMQQAVAQVQGQFSNLSISLRNALVEIYTQANLVTDAGTSGVGAGSSVSPQNKWQVFLNPYTNAVNNSKFDYDGNNVGITAGASYRVSDSFSFGAHFDFNVSDYNAEILDMSTKSTSFALGLHAAYNFTSECYLRGQVAGSVSQADNNYKTGVGATLYADNSNNSEALYLALSTGYMWQIADGHTLTPEVGLAYLSTHTADYDIEWTGATAAGIGGLYDMAYDDSYYSALYANFNLNWRSEWALNDSSSIALLAGLGLRQNLGSGEMESNLRTLGSNYSATATEDLTTFLADVGVEYRKGNLSVSLNYNGGYGYAQTSHGGNAMVKLDF